MKGYIHLHRPRGAGKVYHGNNFAPIKSGPKSADVKPKVGLFLPGIGLMHA